MPFNEGEFDLVFAVYLFHELPRSVRENVLSESRRVLRTGGLFAFCDSLQNNDDIKLNEVLNNFPIDYHEPFFKDYTIWETSLALQGAGFQNIESHYRLLSKYWLGKK